MDVFKLALEDQLLEAGVQFVYASFPTEVLSASGAVYGLVIGNKSGRHTAKAGQPQSPAANA